MTPPHYLKTLTFTYLQFHVLCPNFQTSMTQIIEIQRLCGHLLTIHHPLDFQSVMMHHLIYHFVQFILLHFKLKIVKFFQLFFNDFLVMFVPFHIMFVCFNIHHVVLMQFSNYTCNLLKILDLSHESCQHRG